MTTQKKIDEAAIKYKIKEFVNGTNNSKRRVVSINSVVQADDGTCVFIGRSRLHRPVRNIKTKTNRLR